MATENQYLFITDLPEEILEIILAKLSPYRDLKSAKLVCKQWHRLVTGVTQKLYENFQQCIKTSSVAWTPFQAEAGPTITERYSHCACYYDKSLYVFGGCTSTNTTFNDLWRFDLATRQWIRPLAMGTYPSPKACASMVVYKDNLVLFGGWSHPTPYPLHQAARFFSELHMYNPVSNRWCHVTSLSRPLPKPIAGHSASVVKDVMIVFGGSHVPGVGSNDVWVFDFMESVWIKHPTSNLKPNPRYGQSQVTVNENCLLILGGCGGPNQIFNDIWLLDLNAAPWEWHEISVKNPESAAPQLWCHPACKVDDVMVILSKPVKSNQPPPVVAPRAPVQTSRVWVPPRGEVQPGPMRGPSSPPVAKRPFPDTDDSSSAESSNEDSGRIQSQEMKVLPPGDQGFDSRKDNDSSDSGTESNYGGTASVRPGFPSVRPNAMRNRQRQLDTLRKYEERLRSVQGVGGVGNGAGGTDSWTKPAQQGPAREPRSAMCLHLLDICDIDRKLEASWSIPNEKTSCDTPEETIFYTLVEGRGELVLFGGIQRDINSMQRGIDVNLKSHVVSNNLYIIGSKKQTL
ncbi:F-box only protein 42-like [Haliotis rufescens]|uniref:F-box only protein 42-like n=1 Tax=Haliotis rufescens TaxID=6454 RepID=UPI001EAFE115|nr:F-box only protein 42-like [Haliotis rufescens]